MPLCCLKPFGRQARTASLALTLAAIATAHAAEPVRRIPIQVTPYYEAAATPDAAPRVAVGRVFDAALSSTRREEIAAMRDTIAAQPQRVTPMTMMVLAVRLYDVGLRDDAVFWFYAAKNRYVTLAEVLDMESPSLAGVAAAIRAFATLAGPYLNSYAFCDPAKQQATAQKAVDWVEAHPYETLFFDQLPARPGERTVNLGRAIAKIKETQAQERQQLADPAKRAAMQEARKARQVDQQFCWKG